MKTLNWILSLSILVGSLNGEAATTFKVVDKKPANPLVWNNYLNEMYWKGRNLPAPPRRAITEAPGEVAENRYEDAIIGCYSAERDSYQNSLDEFKKRFPQGKFRNVNPQCQKTTRTCADFYRCEEDFFFSIAAIYNNHRNNAECRLVHEIQKNWREGLKTTIECFEIGRAHV